VEGGGDEKNEQRTSNTECRMGKEETEELIKLFIMSIKTAEKKQ
jgi:hypothetical protein